MIRRTLLLCILTTCFASASTASARTQVIAQRSSKLPHSLVYLTHALLPTHRYRVDIIPSGHQAFTGYGIENYTYVANKRLFEGSKPLKLKGTSSHSFNLTLNVKGRLTGWLVALNVELSSGKGLSVRIIDLGTKG